MAVAVAETLGGIHVHRDIPGAPAGTHDFDILVGGSVIALEVTSAADGATTALWEAVTRSDWLEPSLQVLLGPLPRS